MAAPEQPEEELSAAAVAVAVSGGRSRRALRWAVAKLLPHASRVVLLHVLPCVSSIPAPSGRRTPVENADPGTVELYEQERRAKARKAVLPFTSLCGGKEAEIVLVEGDDTAKAILGYLAGSEVKILVLGCSSFSWLTRILKRPDVPSTVLKLAPNDCHIFLVSRQRLILKTVNDSANGASDSASHIRKIRRDMFTLHESSRIFFDRISRGSIHSESSKSMSLDFRYTDSETGKDGSISSDSYRSSAVLSTISSMGRGQPARDSFSSSDGNPGTKALSSATIGDNNLAASHSRSKTLPINPSEDSSLAIIHSRTNSEDLAEMERLRAEVQNTLAKYNRACKDLIVARKQVQLLSMECSKEARRVKDAEEREQIIRQIAAEEKARHLEAIKEVEEAKQLLAKESLERHIAEITAVKASSEKLKVVDALFSSGKRCKRYTSTEIEVATDNFSPSNKIGEGGYGNVYKGHLDHTAVAIKVLCHDAIEKKQQFLKEVEVLTQLHHPHMVLLLGVCPESRCLVYEYMENGSLEDRLFCRNNTPPLPWATRFRIILEVACCLAFLHGSKPEPIVHCDLKPANILLDRNYVSKIADVGLARLMSDIVPDSITEYRDTVISGTLHYMDPEYQRTGTIRPKSDLYAFGIIALQLLTARRPVGLLLAAEVSIDNGTLSDLLDKSVTGWPLAESEKLAEIALKCASLRCRDRPDLESEVIPALETIVSAVEVGVKLQNSDVSAPSHYHCPILQEVMVDPYIAADGFTYEHRAIKAWLSKHNLSPVTRLRLRHTCIIPNYTMRAAIQEWKSQMERSG